MPSAPIHSPTNCDNREAPSLHHDVPPNRPQPSVAILISPVARQMLQFSRERLAGVARTDGSFIGLSDRPIENGRNLNRPWPDPVGTTSASWRTAPMSDTGKRRVLACVIVALALVGMLVTGALLSDHDGGWDTGHNTGTAFLLQLCTSDALPSASCADVIGSRWGSFDFYVGARRILLPMSFIGLAYFLMIATWVTFCGLPPIHAKWRRRGVGLFVTGGMLVSISLTIVMAFSLQSWCPLCLLAHGANLAIFVALAVALRLGRNQNLSHTTTPSEAPRYADLRFGLLAVTTSVAAMGATWVYFDTAIETRRQWRRASGLKNAIEALQDNTAFTMREFFAEPVRSIPLQEPARDDARPAMVVFRSFESDASACFEQDWRDGFSQSAGHSLRIEYRHTPPSLIRSIEAGKPLDDAQTAPLRAMEAARLQHNPTGYDRLTVALFRSRRNATARDYAAMARRAGLDADRLLRDMANESVRRSVVQDLSLAAALGVDHTPAIFIEGRRVPNLCVKSSTFWAAIGHEPGLTESLASLDRTWVDDANTSQLAASDITK